MDSHDEYENQAFIFYLQEKATTTDSAADTGPLAESLPTDSDSKTNTQTLQNSSPADADNPVSTQPFQSFSPDADNQVNVEPLTNSSFCHNETKKIKRHKEKSFLSKGAAACVIAFSILTASACGFVFGLWTGNHQEASVTQGIPAAVSTLPTQNLISTTSGLSVAEVAAATANSVVEITTESVQTGMFIGQYIASGAGSGVILSSDGYIVTNNHVIDGANKITITLKNGNSYQGKVIGADSKTDIALLKIAATGLTPVVFGDSDQLIVGELAVAIGNPLGQLGGTVTDGIISALDREIELDNTTMHLLQTNAAINPGNSGGGLFDGNGQLIGLVVAKSSGNDVEGLGFAIPSNLVKTVVADLKNHGYVQGRIDIGMNFIDISTPQMAMMYRVQSTGVYVQQVTPDSNADRAGIQSGSRVLSVGGQVVESISALNKALEQYKVGDTINMVLVQNDEQKTVHFKLSEYKG